MNSDIFSKQMDNFQNDIKDYADKFPEHAAQLKCLDWKKLSPDMLHLIYSSAYFCSQIRERVESMPLTNGQPNDLMPCLSMATPSRLIICVKTMHNECITIDQHTQFLSKPVGDEKTACVFSPICEEHVVSTKIKSVICTTDIHTTQVKIHMSACNTDQPLKFHINLPSEKAMVFYYYVFNKLNSIDILDQDENKISSQCTVAPCYLNTVAQVDVDDLLSGLQNIQDFAEFREKFMFFEIDGIPVEKVSGGDFFVILNFNQLPLEIKSGDILLNCIPVINLFETTCEPIFQDHRDYEYPISPDYNRPKSSRIVSVTEVHRHNQAGQSSKVEHFSIRKDGARYYLLPEIESSDQCIYLVSSFNCNGDYPALCIRKKMELSTTHSEISGADVILEPTLFIPPREDHLSTLSGVVRFLSDPERFFSIKKLRNTLVLFSDNEAANQLLNSIDRIIEKPFQCFEQGTLNQYNVHEIYLVEDNAIYNQYLLSHLLHRIFVRFCSLSHLARTHVYFSGHKAMWTFYS